MNILLVDDESILVESIKIGLEMKGYRVINADNASQALNLLDCDGVSIDMVVTDYVMPAMNGMELLAAIRRIRPNLPVIMMTAYAETSLVIEALKNYCDAFIEKPFKPETLISEIERVKSNPLRNTQAGNLHLLLPKIVHQINNPLCAISGFAELIKLNQNDGKSCKYADKIIDAVEQISRTNKEIINAGSGTIEEGRFLPIDIDVLIGRCLELFQGLFLIKKIQVKKTSPSCKIKVLGDEFELEQVFRNLLLNAVEAMDGLSNKKLTVTVTPRWVSSLVEIFIKDTGCGIREESLSKIFDPYHTDKCNGNGLGLEIVKNIVEKHGGKVQVESHVGIGSSFIVHLPVLKKDMENSCLMLGNEK